MVQLLRIAVLGSTKGTGLQDLIDSRIQGVKICFVLSNKQDAYILERARKCGIRTVFLDPKGRTREEYDEEISRLLWQEKVDMVLLIGYMKLLSDSFVNFWRNRVMNIHPSLLPKHAGGMDMDVHEQVIASGDRVSGCSLIFIDEGIDSGPIILQREVKVERIDTPETLKEKVQREEGRAIIEGVRLFRDNRIRVVDGRVKII